MRLTVLGGSAASPNRGAGCSGYLVRSGVATLLVDPGHGTLPELRRHADFRSLSAVFVSHLHLDHVLDLLALRHALAYNPVPAPGPVPVWLPPGGAAWLAEAVAPFDACDEPGPFASTVAVGEYDPEGLLTTDGLAVRFAPAVHWLPTWAMRIEDAATGAALGYTADTGPSADLRLLAGVDLLLAETTLPDDDPTPPERRRSLTAEDAGRLATRLGAGSAGAHPPLGGAWLRRGAGRCPPRLPRTDRPRPARALPPGRPRVRPRMSEAARNVDRQPAVLAHRLSAPSSPVAISATGSATSGSPPSLIVHAADSPA